MIFLFSVKIKGVYFGVSFSFFAVAALLFLCADSQTDKIFTALTCCFFHECGHLFFMLLFGSKPERVTLYGGGIKISPFSDRLTSQNREILILLAGCIFNFICAAVWYLFKGLDFFCEVNILLGVFNLLPFKYFDGGRVLEMLLDGGKAYDLVKALFLFMGAVCIILMLINNIVSISFMLTFAFVVLDETVSRLYNMYK